MIRNFVSYRATGLVLGLLIPFATGGCAHFHNAEVRAQERTVVDRAEPGVAEAEAPPPPAQESPPARAAALPAPAPKVALPARPGSSTAVIPVEPHTPVARPSREPVPEPAVAAPAASGVAPAPATDNAIIIFANTPSVNCQTCETLKISVAPSGQVLMERGAWGAGHSNWRYKRSRADVGPDRAAAFAASLNADRPVGTKTIAGAGCAAPATGDDGLSVEWIEADRDDRLTVKFGCRAGPLADRLRHAPDLLGLRQLAFP